MKTKSPKSVYIIRLAAAVLATVLIGSAGAAHAQLGLPGIRPGVDRLPIPEIERPLRKTEQELSKATDEALETATEAVGEPLELVNDAVSSVLREFVPAIDPTGLDIEADTLIVLVDTAEASSLFASGLEVVRQRELSSVGLTLLTLKRTGSSALSEALADFEALNPGVTVDYNHLYEWAQTDVQPGPAPQDSGEGLGISSALKIGVIDSDVMPSHRALADLEIVRRDFAGHEGQRPQTHGTAVASLIASASGNEAAVYSASVFFQLPNRAPGATAEGLAAALDWLASENVDVINMSLAGPGNDLLELAVARLLERGETIVAAVGNNGPKGDPQYPAAYEGVIGVTAVDRNDRVFRYANRGPHVDYAAIGVNMKVADSTTGGWRIESGTSMASPFVAVVVAKTLNSGSVDRDALMSWLIADAKDLGRRGHDPVFGHGLIMRPPLVISSN